MNDLFFQLSKLLWTLISPDHLLLLMLLFGTFFRRTMIGKLNLFIGFFAALVITLYPIGNLLLNPLEQQFPRQALPDKVAGIIILGGGESAELSLIHQQPQFNEGAERLMILPQLAARYPDSKIVFTGGSGSLLRPDYRGGDVVEQWLKGSELASRVKIERQSRNTYENAIYSQDYRSNSDESWLLVTSAFHMPRALGVFKGLGWQVIPFPVDYRATESRFLPNFTANMRNLKTASHEWIGLLVYYLTGKTDRFFPQPGSE